MTTTRIRNALHAAVFATVLAGASHAADYYVSPDGNDANPGLGAGQALCTIQAAVDKAQPGDTVLVRGGTYRETVIFPRSGTADTPISVKPYKNEKVVVTGCEPVTGWTLHDAAKGIWKTPMPWTLGLGRNQVFVNGEVMIEARHPNTPDPDLGMYVSGLSPLWPTFAELSLPKETMKEQPGRIVGKVLEGFPDDHWKGACYYGVHYEGWSAQTGIIESSKSGAITVGDRTRTWWFGPAYGGGYSPEEGRGMIVGHMNALDQPGEWHWQDNTLYLIPKYGLEPFNVEAKKRQLAFDLSDREHIRISGLDIHAASMRLQDSANCVVDNCRLSYISHFTRFYDIGQIENGRDTIKSGDTGIFVGGHDNAFLNCSVRFSAGAGFYLRGYHHTIHNCLIDEISYTSHYLNAITDAVSDFNDYENFLVGGHVITFNTMRNAGRHFFNFYGNGPSTASRTRSSMDYMATLFAHNHLYNGMLQTKDAGFLTGYYCSGGTLNGLNSQVIYNVMHDSYDLAAMRWNVLGIVYLDAGSCDVDLHHNLLWAAPGSLQRGLWYNTMCVDVHEHDNLFHPEFERTCAELTAKDFPDGKPFRFGHDFDAPPPVPAWPQLDKLPIEAEACTAQSAGIAKSATGLNGMQDGDWFCLGNVDFTPGWQSMVMRFAGDVKELNTDRAARGKPRHQKVTDPLIMEAVTRDDAAPTVRQQWTFIRNVTDGSWIRFNQVPLGDGYRRFRAIYGNDQAEPRQVEVHLDSVDGPLVGQVSLPQTDVSRGGNIQIYQTATGEVSVDAKGTHDIFLVFRSPDPKQKVGEFEYFRFEQYRGQIALQKNEVKFELRVGARDGDKIGEFYPRCTRTADNISNFVAPLEPVAGTQPLFVVVRSALAVPIGAIDAFSLEKASQPIDWSRVGVPPRKHWWGKMVLPEPTNRPCARPNDKYPHTKGAAAAKTIDRPRAFFQATRIPAPPTLDGKLDDWPTADAARTLVMAESYDATLTAAPPSQAWLAYDDAALYIAMKHPVKNAAALATSSHAWGQEDGAEIAFQDGLSTKPGAILTLYGFPDGHFVSQDYGGAPAQAVALLQKSVAYKATVAADHWSCEWRIPFEACGFTPATAPLILLNLGVKKTAPDAWVIWRGTGAATYEVSNGGVLVFSAEFAALPMPPTDKLEVWLDATDAATVTKDETGKVSLWKDKSGKGRDAHQDSPANRPGLAPDGLNGKPALRFDEKASTRLELPDLSDQKITATIFAVFSNPVEGAEVNHDPRILTASDGKDFDYISGLCASVKGMETGGPRQAVFVQADRWAKQVHIGCFSPGYQTFFTGQIAEILAYSRELKPDEQERVRAYLASKWGLR
ncbi:MAG: hypothetical protein A3K19_32695 [Lentisphaerae bacterium RIFOXYB12_FULL_65_16]|nr:MAG: hypothetical protein A3K18_07870 [Lentisphaerae bacterium RIFOXYA12_64_32]OGV84455.1 MAG: hypothetical protein A3K19_32695 [Lentisphaerae bacterium RIFOXYB12_FULL_65_16]